MAKKGLVFVGLSGGVDSSVSAALLKQQGYDVHGVFIQTWSPDWMQCTWQNERRDAMRVAIHLGIPFHDLDLSEAYKNHVADFFIAEYAAGRTPNPDVLCNRHVKFGAMWDWARARGADFVATGHYAMVVNSQTTRSPFQGMGICNCSHAQLYAGPDNSKDQSYFLWTLTQNDLAHILFPIGHLHKARVRELARSFAIPVATKKDSQGICFLGHVDMAEFLSHYITLIPGKVYDIAGNCIGEHDGSVVYTLGQRHGFRLDKSSKEPLYVVAKNNQENTITVAPHHYLADSQFAKTDITLGSVVWRDAGVAVGDIVHGVIRYHGEKKSFRVIEVGKGGEPFGLAPLSPDTTITPGQSIVFYRDSLCQGGGVVQ
jgi:tRNA-specific 2-thiouridylase